MNFNNKNINQEMETNSIIKYYNDKIDNLWTNEIWKNYKLNTHIKNKQIYYFFNEFKNIEKEYNEEQVKFSISDNYDIMIEDNKKSIKKKIANFKKDNLMMLKIHSDCFIEYHNIVFDYINKKNNLSHYDLKVDILQKNTLETKLILDDNIIKEQIINFENEYVEYKNNNNLNDIINTLEQNIFKIKKNLFNFILKINPSEPILLIDVENILKSFEIQNFLKLHINEEKFNKYFHIWNNGYFGDSNNIETTNNESITLSEYSSKVKYVEPYTSLNLSVEKKLKLINIINDKLINNINTINILTSNLKSIKNTNTQKINSKFISDTPQINTDISFGFGCDEINKIIHSSNQSETSTQSNYKTNSNLFIPIQYNDKFDIREQDDHLLLLIYMILKKINLNPIIISNDKFKWFKSFDTLEIKNFKTLYDYDLGKKKIIIDIPYTPPIYKINSNYYMFPFVNYPQLEENISQNIKSIMNIDEFKKILETKIKKVSSSDIKNIYSYLFNLSIIETNIEINQEFFSIVNFCLNYLEYIKNKLNKIDNFLSSNSKEKIFKISIETNSNVFDRHEIKNYTILMDNYIVFIELYIVLKFVVFKNYSKINFTSSMIVNLCKIFDIIIEIYDLFDTHIYKIRKLSCSKSELDILFKKINNVYIYVRKQGYMKKNIFF